MVSQFKNKTGVCLFLKSDRLVTLLIIFRATRGARNPNPIVAIEHARHVCRLMLARFLWTSTKNEWNEQHAI